MNQPKKERFKTSVGGQALMEGIMMRGPKLICCAVRKPDGTIETKIDPVKNHGIWTKIPLVRGAISMIESLIVGYRYMMYSAQVSMGDDYDPEEEETAFEKWTMRITVFIHCLVMVKSRKGRFGRLLCLPDTENWIT